MIKWNIECQTGDRCHVGNENASARCCFLSCKDSGDLNDFVLFTGKHSAVFLFPPWDHCRSTHIQTNTSSFWTNLLKASPKNHISLIYIRLKVWGSCSISQIVPFISLTDKKLWCPAEVFPFATLTCAQCIDRSSVICESNWLSAEAVSPSSARTDAQLQETLFECNRYRPRVAADSI